MLQLEQITVAWLWTGYVDMIIRHGQSLASRELAVEVQGSTRQVGHPTRQTTEPLYSARCLRRSCSSDAEAAEVWWRCSRPSSSPTGRTVAPHSLPVIYALHSSISIPLPCSVAIQMTSMFQDFFHHYKYQKIMTYSDTSYGLLAPSLQQKKM